MLDLTEVSKILDRVVSLHKDKDHIDIMLVAVGDLQRAFNGNLSKTDFNASRRYNNLIEVVFSFNKPFETDTDEDGEPMAPTRDQLESHSMEVKFKFGSGWQNDWIDGCRMMDIFVRNSGRLCHKHIDKNTSKQVFVKDVLDWAFKIDQATKALEKERSLT